MNHWIVVLNLLTSKESKSNRANTEDCKRQWKHIRSQWNIPAYSLQTYCEYSIYMVQVYCRSHTHTHMQHLSISTTELHINRRGDHNSYLCRSICPHNSTIHSGDQLQRLEASEIRFPWHTADLREYPHSFIYVFLFVSVCVCFRCHHLFSGAFYKRPLRQNREWKERRAPGNIHLFEQNKSNACLTPRLSEAIVRRINKGRKKSNDVLKGSSFMDIQMANDLGACMYILIFFRTLSPIMRNTLFFFSPNHYTALVLGETAADWALLCSWTRKFISIYLPLWIFFFSFSGK